MESETGMEVVLWLGKLDEAYSNFCWAERRSRREWFKRRYGQAVYELVFENIPFPVSLHISMELQHLFQSFLLNSTPTASAHHLAAGLRSGNFLDGRTRFSFAENLLEMMLELCQDQMIAPGFQQPLEGIIIVIFKLFARTSAAGSAYDHCHLAFFDVRRLSKYLLVRPLVDRLDLITDDPGLFSKRCSTGMVRQNQLRLIEAALQSSVDELCALVKRGRTDALHIEIRIAVALLKSTIKRFFATSRFRSERLELLLMRYLVEDEVNMQVAKAVHNASWSRQIEKMRRYWKDGDPELEKYGRCMSIYE
ncbi:hypothetical protein BJ508DRAFT_419014 [Ascobolus immersus RN42]|uniref:Uncharacterized protein n=1 Tax=Ascobolus immersus RN42 TaxID=1160509 RepID=A0A3N4HHK6_ASCIM|nr:hypothetical protein BJ508DRAFT_419014 [Ascobolus immersus RN42]